MLEEQRSSEVQQCIELGDFNVVSPEEMEFEPDYDLVKGHGLRVMNGSGVVYDEVRGFSPLSDKVHLIRLNDGVWVLSYTKNKKGKRVTLKKANVHCKERNVYLMFDERGKLHFAQVSPHYKRIEV